MSKEDAYVDAPERNDEQVVNLIRDAMWTCDQSIPIDTKFHVPGERFLPDLKAAQALIRGVLEQANASLPHDCQREIKLLRTHNASPRWMLKDHYPEIARVCRIEIALFGIDRIIHDFENEGRVAEVPKLAKTRRTP